MTQLAELQSYMSHYFPEDNDDRIYKSLENKYIEYIQYLANKNKWEVRTTYRNNFHFSMCVISNKIPVIISIYDVRKEYMNWYDDIHIKLLKRNIDYKSANTFQYTVSLPKLEAVINKITNNELGDDIDINDIF